MNHLKLPRTDNELYAKQAHRLILDTGLPLKIAAQGLGLTSDAFMKWWSNPTSGLVLDQIKGLGQLLNISEDDIIKGDYDIHLVRRRVFGDPDALPERYEKCRFSYVRSSAHIVEYIALSRGRHFADAMLRKLNVSPLSLSSLDNRINILFIADLLHQMRVHGFSQRELDYVGKVLFLSIGDTELGRKFYAAKNYFQCYQIVAEHLTLFDENFKYRSELRPDSITVYAKYDLEKVGDLNIPIDYLKHVLRYRRIVLEWFPILSKLSPLTAEVKKCISQGDKECVYVVPFPKVDLQILR